MAAKFCDSCKSATATLFCRADSAFLCRSCDFKIHSANKLASRHARVWVCEVCEHAPASITCKADAAHLCMTCDRDIHLANPLARRHERVPVTPFFESKVDGAGVAATARSNADINKLLGEDNYSDMEAEEAEAASWLLTNPNGNRTGKVMGGGDPKSIDYIFADDGMEPYLDLHFSAHPNESADCVVPEGEIKLHKQNQDKNQSSHHSFYDLASYNSQFDDAYETSASKQFSLAYNTNQPVESQSMSSSSLEVGVVPDAKVMADVSKGVIGAVAAVSGIDREARVLRYREKRKNRKFEKTIRYASRKAYAETRPRIKGRFAKRSETEVVLVRGGASNVEDIDGGFGVLQYPGYGVVPSF